MKSIRTFADHAVDWLLFFALILVIVLVLSTPVGRDAFWWFNALGPWAGD